MTDNALAQAGTLAELFNARVQASPQGPAYREFDPASNQWKHYSWGEIGDTVARWKNGLLGLGLAHGSRIAVLLPNGTNAVGVDQGTMAAGLVPVPLHAIDNPGSIAYILNDSEASALVVATLKQWTAVIETGEPFPNLKLIVITEEGAEPMSHGPVKVVRAQAWLAGAAKMGDAVGPAPDDLATMVYTSGTTGKPKGVMLTHRNVVANVKSSLSAVTATADDVFLSFLPLSHTFERTAGYYLPIATGSCVAYVRSTALIAADLKVVRPTILISVPRIYERFFAKLQEAMSEANSLTRGLFEMATAVGWRRFCRVQRIPLGDTGAVWLDNLLWPVLDLLVAKKIRALFGGRLRIAVSGGAPLSPAVAHCFLGLGVPILQGYGMTETSPVVATNRVENNWPDSVGPALDGVQVRIGENAELQVRGDNVMKGYWKRPEDTQKAMTQDGWLHTGDQGSIESGRIRILGRIKEIIVTSTGEKISPADLELAITADPLFDQALVIGEGKPFLLAIVVLNLEQWKTLEKHAGIEVVANPQPEDASLNSPAARKALLGRIGEATKSFPSYAMPRAVWATLEQWTIEKNLMTPTLKLKRNNLQSRYQAEIDAIYQGQRPGKS